MFIHTIRKMKQKKICNLKSIPGYEKTSTHIFSEKISFLEGHLPKPIKL